MMEESTIGNSSPKDIGKLTEESAIVMALANWAGMHVLPADDELAMICDAALKFAARRGAK